MSFEELILETRSAIRALVRGLSPLRSAPAALAIALAVCAMPARAQYAGPVMCGDVHNAFGPFDYRHLPPGIKSLVEDAHFTPKVRALQAGQTGPIAHDIDYTLRAFPNNPAALMAMARLSTKQKRDPADGALFHTECYFDRAIRWTPDDPMPRLLYAWYLYDHKRIAEAQTQLDSVEQLRGDPASFDLDYNLGLLYFDVGAYDKAALAAQRAYALGAPLPALMNKLKSKGKWVE